MPPACRGMHARNADRRATIRGVILSRRRFRLSRFCGVTMHRARAMTLAIRRKRVILLVAQAARGEQAARWLRNNYFGINCGNLDGVAMSAGDATLIESIRQRIKETYTYFELRRRAGDGRKTRFTPDGYRFLRDAVVFETQRQFVRSSLTATAATFYSVLETFK